MLKLKVALGLIVLIAMLSATEAMPQKTNSSAPAAVPDPTSAPASTTATPNGSPFHGSDVATMIALAVCGLIGHRLSN